MRAEMLGERHDEGVLIPVGRELEHQVSAAAGCGKDGNAREMHTKIPRLFSDRLEGGHHSHRRGISQRLRGGPRALEVFRRYLADDGDERVTHDAPLNVTTSSSMNGPTYRGRPTVLIPRAMSGATRPGS